MGDKSDSFKSDSNLLAQDTIVHRKPFKRAANGETGTLRKKGRYLDDSSDNECSKSKSPQNHVFASNTKLQILPGGNCQQSEPNLSPPVSEEVLPSKQTSSNNLVSGNLSENSYKFKNPATIDTSEYDPSNDLKSPRNPEKSLHPIHNTDNLPQDQPNPIDNSDVSSRKNSSFKPSYIFRDLLHTPKNDVEEFSYEWRIFQPNGFGLMDELPEKECIFSDTSTGFKNEGKLKDPTIQNETCSINTTDQGNQNCYNWDELIERWEDLDILSGSTSAAQHQEPETKKEPRVCLSSSSTSKSIKITDSVSFNGQTKKRPCIAKSPETITSSFKSSSSDEEHGSNRKFVLPSFENEMEMLVQPVSTNISEASSKLEKFLKNTKIKLSENDQKPPFSEKFLSLDPADLLNRKNGSILSNDTKYFMSLLEKEINSQENKSVGTNSSTDKTEELTVEEDPSDDDAKMIS